MSVSEKTADSKNIYIAQEIATLLPPGREKHSQIAFEALTTRFPLKECEARHRALHATAEAIALLAQKDPGGLDLLLRETEPLLKSLALSRVEQNRPWLHHTTPSFLCASVDSVRMSSLHCVHSQTGRGNVDELLLAAERLSEAYQYFIKAGLLLGQARRAS